MPNKILLTGGTGGLGSAMLKYFSECGYTVVAPTRMELNLGDQRSLGDYIGATVFDFDILVNNAGINILSEFNDYSDEVWDSMVSVNVTSAMRLMRACLPHMRRRGYGRIVNIASIYSNVSRLRRSLYGATKAALAHLSQSVAVEEGLNGILVNAVSPGFIATELTRKNNSPDEIAALEKAIPVGRMGTPEEIAILVEFLISSKNSYITGQNITADGGFTAL